MQLCSRLLWYEDSKRPGGGESLDLSRIEGKRGQSHSLGVFQFITQVGIGSAVRRLE